MKSDSELKQDWFNENQPLGTALGFPACCINEFCNQPPEILNKTGATKMDRLRYKASFVDGKYTGFIPCSEHAQQILSGQITLPSLIKFRSSDFPPFPHYWS